jgi:uncharacterized membrane protein YgcG
MNNSKDNKDPENINIEDNVSDFAGLIENRYITKIDKVIRSIEGKTTAEVAVVTVNSLKGKSIDKLAFHLFNKFGLGKKDENNGILFLIAKEENQFRVEIGSGLEEIIDDDLRQYLINDLISPNFKNKRFGQAILKFVKIVADKISQYKYSKLSIISWVTGIASLILGIYSIISSVIILFYTSFDIYGAQLPVFLLLASPAIALAVVSVICGIISIVRIKQGLDVEIKLNRSIWGIAFGAVTLIITAIVFFMVPQFISFLADILNLSSGRY